MMAERLQNRRGIQHHRQFLALPTLLAVLTLALLNPLACLIHCATPQHLSVVVTGAQLSRASFFCGMTTPLLPSSDAGVSLQQRAQQSPTNAGSLIPRAVYEAALHLAGSFFVVIMLLLFQSTATVSLPMRLRAAPPTPPPNGLR
jgi:hypothetical protein